MSTQTPVTNHEISDARVLGGAFAAWMAAIMLAGVASVVQGAQTSAVAGAAALAFSASVAGFILLPNLSDAKAAFGLIVAWLLVGIGLVAGSGGASSPLAASLLMAPALCAVLRLGWTAEATAAAVLAYPVGAWLALELGPTSGLGAFPELGAAASIVLAGGLATAALARRSSEKAREATLNRRVAEAAHELRTPLNHIMGFADAIESQVFGQVGPRNLEYAGFIKQSGARLLTMINDMLDLSKIDAGELQLHVETFAAKALIEDVAREFSHAADEKRLTLKVEAPEALQLHADPLAWRRILTNTLGNAVKFTPENGRVTVSARAEGARFILDTIDTGPGIPKDEREKLGKPFVQGEGAIGATGTGLGLALVRALAHAHGGKLSFGDGPGGGALVRVEAPIVARAA